MAITGASSGRGLAAAQRSAADGAKVVMLARREEQLRAEADAIGPPAVAIRFDVANPASVRTAFDAIATQFGHLDALLNIAGVARIRTIETYSA